jgi:hypothetical protein
LKITGDVTVEAWVYIAKATHPWVRVIGKGTPDSRSYGLWYTMTGTTVTWLFQRGDRAPFHDCKAIFTSTTTPLNAWYHLAGVIEGQKSSLYVHDLQGKLVTKGELDTAPSGPALDNNSHVMIGHAPAHTAHTGKIAQARIYKGSLSLAEIERDIGSDRLSLVPFRKSHPIDFRLNDDDDQPVLYIVDDSADAKVALVKLELTNTSPQAINIPPLTSGTSRDHHHFALRFHPGTLSASTIKKLTELTIANQATVLKEAADWELACLVGATGPVTLYLSYKGAKKPLKPQEQLTLTLHGVSADAGSGSRGTQVELLPHQLTYVGDDAPITGNRMRYIHITNHRGQKNIPLHVWLVDGNTVLNDGVSETTLKLRISNGSGDRDITLNERSSKEASKFVISFDVGDAEKGGWALTDRTSADSVTVEPGDSDLKLEPIDRGQGPSGTTKEWELTFPQKRVLKKRGSDSSEHVEITLGKIKTALSSGHANLYVRYEGIPGYQDGQFILTVEKSPLVFDKKGNMAVGKLVQKEVTPKVEVAGTVVADSLSVSRHNAPRGGLFFAVAGDLNHAIYNNLSDLDKEGKWDGAKWNTYEGLNIRVGNRNAKPPDLRSALLINGKGHVGIGADLDIKKDLVSSLTINKKIAQDASYDYSAAPLSIFLPLDKHNGGSAPVGTEDILHLVREGVASAAYGNKVSLAIGRYENNGLNSRTQLDIKLTDGPFKDHKPVLSLRSNGCVGIRTANPQEALQIGDLARQDNYLKIFAGEGHRGYPGCAGIKLECGQHNNGYSIAFDRNTLRSTMSPDPSMWGGLRFNRHRPDSHPRTDLYLDFMTGYVGIGTDVPNKNLDVRGELQVMAMHNNETPDIGVFYNNHRTAGIGIGYNQIAAIGVEADRDIFIAPRGLGMVQVKGNLRVNGYPMFNFGRPWNNDDIRTFTKKLEHRDYPSGFLILFLREKSDDLHWLVKKNDATVRHVWTSSNSDT